MVLLPHVALLTYSTKPRGGVVHTVQIGEALRDLGCEVSLLALDKDGSGFYRDVDCEVRLVPTQPAPAEIGQVVHQRIQEYIEYFRDHPAPFDLYHAQDCISANALVLSREAGFIPETAKILRTVHHIDDYADPYLQDCQTRSILRPDLCFCVSQYWQREIKRYYQIDAPILPNGVDIEHFSHVNESRIKVLIKQFNLIGSPIFLTVGGIEPRKNSLRILQAFAQILSQYPQAQLVIAGGISMFNYDDYRDQFFSIADQQGISLGEAVIITGALPDEAMSSLYRCADGFVFPSVKEGFGLVLLEAIASDLPVLTSNIPPFTEFLSPDQVIFVDPYSIDAIATGMRTLLDPQQIPRFVSSSKTILKHYTWTRSATLHLQHYLRCLSGHEISGDLASEQV